MRRIILSIGLTAAALFPIAAAASYTVYLQGGLTYESGRVGVLLAVQELLGQD